MPRIEGAAARNRVGPLRFCEWVDCVGCGLEFEGEFVAAGACVQDVVEPPVGFHRCPACGREFASEFTGWAMFQEAG